MVFASQSDLTHSGAPLSALTVTLSASVALLPTTILECTAMKIRLLRYWTLSLDLLMLALLLAAPVQAQGPAGHRDARKADGEQRLVARMQGRHARMRELT